MNQQRVRVAYGGELYDRTRPLYSGEVRPEGTDLRYLHLGIEDLFWRQGRYGEFDAAEYSMGAYLASVEDPAWGFVAIPVFPSRVFRHSAVYVHAGSGIEAPRDLSGRAVGTPEWSMTASLWIRGILSEHYGADLRSVRWRTGGLAQPGRREKSRVKPPAHFDVRPLERGDTLNQALLEGKIDALISARPPAAFIEGRPEVRRLFADSPAAEQEYFRQTGVFPIMHVVVVRKTLVEEHPWLANNLRNAFEAARKGALARLLDTGICTTSLAWETAYAEREAALLGDAFKYGVEENRATLDALCRYAFEQGFTSRLLQPEELFVPSTVSSAKM
ncbi:MAG TPA: ABC transporter substrate-binding protein [Burkholderiales bacterium]|nr:ABC transporter substrate-binding protein [Burkholderiales bacterium]